MLVPYMRGVEGALAGSCRAEESSIDVKFVPPPFDDDNLEDRHWRTELREVELYENERWAPGPSNASDEATKTEGTWSKSNLKPGERKPWTRGRDGWSGVSDDGNHEVRLARSKDGCRALW